MELQFPLVLDGATGTELQKRGYLGDVCAEKWVIEHPEVIQQIQRNYIDAGSNVIYAPTFGANRIKLEENGIFNQVEQYNKKLVEICREGVGNDALIAGDIAPLGKFLAPLGDMSFEEMYEIYLQQVSALEDANVDLFVIETMMNVAEARAALLAVKAVSKKPVIVSFTATENGKTISGSDIEAVLETLQSMGVDAFGLNCSVGPGQMVRQIEKLSGITQIPLIAKPNAGMPIIENGKTVYHCLPKEYTMNMQKLADLFVVGFGGCCGSNETHIQAISEKSKQLILSKPAKRQDNKLYVSTEKQLFILNQDISASKVYLCDENLYENIQQNREEVFALRISNEEQLKVFENEQYAIAVPLIIECDDEKLLERALRMYQGKCLYQGNIKEDTLEKLHQMYGLVY